MTDRAKLVEKLRKRAFWSAWIEDDDEFCNEEAFNAAADRIEQDGKRIAELEALLPSRIVFEDGPDFGMIAIDNRDEQPDYPTGDVVGACICGSWPGGRCLKCTVINAQQEQTLPTTSNSL